MKIALYKNDSGDLRIEPAHQMIDVDGYMRISEIADVRFVLRKEIASIELAAVQQQIGANTIHAEALKSMIIEGYGDE